MDEEDEFLSGRPYGGVAIICKVLDNISYETITCNTRNLVAIMLKDIHGTPIQITIGVYMPYYDESNRLQTDAYVEYIDGLQCIIDEYGDTVPIKIVGDFNVHLPGPNEHDTVNWYKRNKFTSHSKLMYDCITGNNFNIADLTFRQDVPFTYFNIARGAYSWIDHMLCTEYDLSSVTSCKIIPPDADNVSDHLPLRLTTKLHVPSADTPAPIDQSRQMPVTYWNRPVNNARYEQELSTSLSGLPTYTPYPELDEEGTQNRIDGYMDSLRSCMIQAATKAECIPYISSQEILVPRTEPGAGY